MPPLIVEDHSSKLRSALVQVLRKLGLIGKVAPCDSDLLTIADCFASKPAWLTKGVRTVAAADDGTPFRFGDCLAPSDPKIDKDIPF